ncbi:MAG: hypothetical protein RSA21_07690 [Akkermansia sp.]
MKKSLYLASLLLIGASLAQSANLGNIAFIGDSITHGVNSDGYRYDFWKSLQDNNVEHQFVGVNQGNYSYSGSSTLTYKGQTFNNVHSAGSSWRTYQTSGDYMDKGHQNGTGPGSISSGGYIANWLGLQDSHTYDKVQGGTLTQGTYLNGSTIQDYKGKTMTGVDTPDTFVIMLGTNDFYSDRSGWESNEKVFSYIKNIVDFGRQANADANFVIMSMPSIGQSKNEKGNTITPSYNQYVQEHFGELTAGSGNSQTIYADINKGITNAKGYLDPAFTGDAIHPNNQGNLIIAGNLSRAMGQEQRTAGLIRKSAQSLSSQVALTSNAPTITTTTSGGTITASFTATNPSKISVNNLGNGLIFAATKQDAATYIQYGWKAQNQFTLSFSLKMTDMNSSDNFFTVWLGNGVFPDGFLKIYEDRIEWGYQSSTTLISMDMTLAFNTFTIAYLNGSTGVDAGYYIWLGDQLIGEAKGASGIGGNNNKLLLGAYTYNQSCNAELGSVSFDSAGAYAPASQTIPETSTATLGLFGLVCILLRRRR